MAIAQAPFYCAAYVILAIKNRSLPLPQRCKYMSIFEHAWYVGNIFWSAFAIFLLAWWLKRDVGISRPLLVAMFFLLSTPILYYAFPLSPMSHSVSLAIILLMLLCLGKWERTLDGIWLFAAGFCLGFAVSVHLLNAVYVFFLGPYLYFTHRRQRELAHSPSATNTRRLIRYSGLICLGAFIATLPHILGHKLLFGAIFLNPYCPDCATSQFSISPSNFLTAFKVAFSLKHGFIIWHPILGIALVGALWAWLRGSTIRELSISGLSVILATWALLSGFVNWWAGWSFGNRLFISVYPFFALGIGVLVDSFLRDKRPWKVPVLLLLAAGFILWNMLFFIQYKLGIIPRGKEITFYEYFWQKLILLRHLASGHLALPV